MGERQHYISNLFDNKMFIRNRELWSTGHQELSYEKEKHYDNGKESRRWLCWRYGKWTLF